MRCSQPLPSRYGATTSLAAPLSSFAGFSLSICLLRVPQTLSVSVHKKETISGKQEHKRRKVTTRRTRPSKPMKMMSSPEWLHLDLRCKSGLWGIRFLLILLFVFHSPLVASQRSTNTTSPWRTLSGDSPVVIARGGFSGLFPSSSSSAYQLALLTSLPDVILWCDVHLTKDGAGICAPSLELKNTTNIEGIYPRGQKSYLVNGDTVQGWFPVDYTLNELANVTLIQNLFSRTGIFDGNLFPLETVEQVAQQLKPAGYWLNIQNDLFYTEHNLSMRSFVLAVSRRVVVNYISSPEVGFLRSIATRFRPSTTKLVFQFLGSNEMEPSTNQTYGSLLNNLTFVKTFASGILVPKNYIWRVDKKLYLLAHTALVADAHKEGLEVYASGFANDFPFAYNYSYDPVAEVLSFIDNSEFSVDGLLSDFPITASEAIGCFSNINKNSSEQVNPVIISHNGASGFYPGSTNLAYQKAVSDGADIIDCSVQLTADGLLVCLNSIDLLDGTTVALSSFRSLLVKIPEIQSAAGIFSFNLTWEDINTSLQPLISTPFPDYYLTRNPEYENDGNFLTLPDFLKFAKSQSVPGILLNIEHAVYLAEKQGFGIIDAVLKALNDAGLSNQTITIQSTDSSVLTKFKQQTKYKLMYKVNETISDADNSTIGDIKKFADSVAINKDSIFPQNKAFLLGTTEIVDKLHAFGLLAHVYVLRNEFVAQAWDFFSDPIVEINSYFQGAGVDGIITDFPGTAKAYKRNSCLKLGDKAPAFMNPVQAGALLQLVTTDSLPPAAAPLPVLKESDISEPPFPPVSTRPTNAGGSTVPPTSSPSSGHHQATLSMCLSIVMLLGSSLCVLRPLT